MADPARVSPISEINDLVWKPGLGPSTEFHGLFPGLETRKTGDPLEKVRPAALAGANRAKSANPINDVPDYRTTGPAAASVPRIIGEHWGDA